MQKQKSAGTLIVIVTFNSEEFIERCLDSILTSDYKDWFLIIIDNNSKDQTVSRIRDFTLREKGIDNKNFKLVKLNKNIGFSAAVDYAVFDTDITDNSSKHKNFKYLVLVNPDLRLEKNSLGNLLQPFYIADSEKNEIGVVGGLILEYEGNTIQHFGGDFRNNFITSHPGKGNIFYDFTKPEVSKIKEVKYVTGALFSTKLSIFRDLKGFDRGYRPVYFEELDYCLKIKKTGLKIVVNPYSVSRHFEGASIRKFSTNFYKYYHKNRIRCALINYSLKDFFRLFLAEELKWLRNKDLKEQYGALVYAYFLNFLFLPYNLIVKIRNHLIISKLRLKYDKLK
ncbi:MAG: glycosyltransferase family 2 protein [Actinobacteria bacterium]|nr:glycosyltransferase family 2 protein [Actinomycetota bacterium]